MRVGSLVKHIEYEFFGIAIQEHGDSYGAIWLVLRADNTVRNWYYECELEVLCE